MFNSEQPHRWQPTRLPHPWDSPGRILEWVAISFSNACMHVKSLQSCPTLCNPIDGSPPGSSVHRILQARILEWVAISFSEREPTIYFKIFICPVSHQLSIPTDSSHLCTTVFRLHFGSFGFLAVAPLFLSLATPHGMGDLSSPAMD